ncbi:MAG: response regulator [Dehalococcoidia bacterium]|nr:response regulator [Dehalococcoidia bacterium]
MKQGNVILASIKDVYFASQLEGAAGVLGHRVEYLQEPRDLLEKVLGLKPGLLIVNLGDDETDWSGIITEAKGMGGKLPVLAFGQHTDLVSREKALAAGADTVVSNALFSTDTPRLIEKYMK